MAATHCGFGTLIHNSRRQRKYIFRTHSFLVGCLCYKSFLSVGENIFSRCSFSLFESLESFAYHLSKIHFNYPKTAITHLLFYLSSQAPEPYWIHLLDQFLSVQFVKRIVY